MFRVFHDFLKYLGGSEVKNKGAMVMSTRSENNENDVFLVFPKNETQKLRVPKWNRIIRRNFRATLFLKIKIKNGPPDPPRPQIRIFPEPL